MSITREAALKKLFTRFDTSRDGQLNKEEIAKMLAKLDPNCEDVAEEAVNYLQTNNKDENSTIDFKEFCAAFDKRDNCEVTEEELKKIFAKLDTDNSGCIEKNELAFHLMDKKKWSQSKCDECFSKCDVDKDNKIDYNELLKNFRS